MKEESTLKKQFTERDVQRMRNIISKKHGDKTQIQSVYEKLNVKHEEGDTWEEKGKTWTIKNGIKQNITRFDGFKKLGILPMVCPQCSTAMALNQLNQKMYAIHGTCFNCVIKKETALKASGGFKEYENKMMEANKKALLDDMDSILETWLLEKNSFVTEQGDVEDWAESTANKQKMYNEAKESLQKIREDKI